MKQFDFSETKETLHDSDIVSRITFKTMNLRDSYALSAVICPIQVAIFRLSRGKSAHFQKKDCFECLSPHDIAV